MKSQPVRLLLAVLFLLASSSLQGAVSYFQSLEGFVHADGNTTPVEVFNTLSPGFLSGLDANNLGTFSFTWTNTTGLDLNAVTFTVFLDADFDRDDNTFFNEYGEFISLVLPVLAPLGSIPSTSWEIDEPEYVFGNIYTHSLEGTLDETNAVPSSAPDDVSLALQITTSLVLAGQSFTIFGTLSETDAAGLLQFDPDSDAGFYFNAYGELGDPPPDVPEPHVSALMALGLAGCYFISRFRKQVRRNAA